MKNITKLLSFVLSVPFVFSNINIINAETNTANTFDYFDIFIEYKNNNSILTFPDGTEIRELKYKPELDEIIELLESEKIDGAYFFINTENPYIAKFTRKTDYTNEKMEIIDCDTDIDYIFDKEKMEILSYTSGDLIQSLENNKSFYINTYNEMDNAYEKYRVTWESDSNTFSVLDAVTSVNYLGDINSDGKVDLTDLSELSLAIIGDKILTENQLKAADIDENGKADLPDLARLRQYLSKVITSLRGSNESSAQGNMFNIAISTLEWNKTTYRYNDTANSAAYTKKEYLGKVSEFNSNCTGHQNHHISPDDSVFTVKETNDVLFVAKADGTIVIMSSPEWSLEKYEPERLNPDYIAPDSSNDIPTGINGLCQ